MANAGGRAKFVIQPFKHNQQMDEEYAIHELLRPH